MRLSDGDQLHAAYYCAFEVVRMRRNTGQPIPPWLAKYLRELDTEIRLSARGHQNWCTAEESETLSSVEVAEKLSKPEKWVRRHHGLLGGVKHGDRWRYSRAVVERFALEVGMQ